MFDRCISQAIYQTSWWLKKIETFLLEKNINKLDNDLIIGQKADWMDENYFLKSILI